MQQYFKKHLINFRGVRLKSKYILFESDDWGGIRIPNQTIKKKLEQQDLINKNDPFSNFDTLENTDDLNSLFNVLAKFKDCNGKPPILTTNFILNNPDFSNISKDNFKKYYSENFIKTYKSYKGSEDAWEIILKGMAANYIKPQFHASEHLNVVRWMKYLDSGDKRFHSAFKKNCFSINDITINNRRKNLMATYDYANSLELNFVKSSINNGLKQFNEIFGYQSITSIAPCYVWDEQIERELQAGGVKGLQGSFTQNIPVKEGLFKTKYNYIGQQNNYKQYYFVRNGLFEPSINHNIDWVDKCMESIDIAFKWGKPAIISTHRINFAGRLDLKKRDSNLKMFEQLLFKIKKKWPEANFIDSSTLLKKYPNL